MSGELFRYAIAVRPYVFALSGRPPLIPNPEVAGLRWVTLDRLLHPETYHSVRLQIRGESRDVPAYELEEAVGWPWVEVETPQAEAAVLAGHPDAPGRLAAARGSINFDVVLITNFE